MMDRAKAYQRAKELVAKMTVEERAGQLRYNAPAIPRLGLPAYNWWNEALHGVARAGTATVFPQAIGLAAIFDEEFHRQVAEVIATEGRAKYNAQAREGDRDIYKGLTFWSPNINIFRDPRWGRGHETYGEDPFLTARLGVAFIKGLQGEGQYMKAAACAKHFAVHSGPEGIRHSFDAIASPKDMEETYLPAFQAAVQEGGVEAVMGAYNRVNGEPACGSRTLLKDILRNKWGFQGHVVSDCWAISDFHTHHMVTSTAPESAALALENGCDLNCGVTYLHILTALQEGLVKEEQITAAAERLMTTRILLGMMDNDCPYDAIPYTDCDTPAHHALAVTAAEKSMVLLKNDGILPLAKDQIRTLAVIGPNADSIAALEGNYAGTSSRYVTFLEGLRTCCEAWGIRPLYSKGCALSADKTEGLAQADDRLAEALSCATAADVVIACVGLDASLEGEQGDASNLSDSGDKVNLLLPPAQQRLMAALERTGKPLVTVLASGSSLRVDEGNALLLAWYPGQGGGTALARLLFGEANPSGKLPVTFYSSSDSLPDFTDYAMKGRTYRYLEEAPLYPFGFGLSYSRFQVTHGSAVPCGDGAQVTLRIRNHGPYAGDTAAQVYVQPHSSHAPLHPALKGFRRAHLAVGEEKEVTVQLCADCFTVVDEEGRRFRDGDHFTVFAGLSQPDAKSVEMMGEAPLAMEIVMK